MKSGRCLYAGALVVALVVGFGLWRPSHVKADHGGNDGTPRFKVDPSWPRELPAPNGYGPVTWPTLGDFPQTLGTTTYSAAYTTTANRWVQGEVAGSATDQWDNIYTINRGWQIGATVNGVVQNAESGAIDGNDATAAHALPSPPIVAFAPDGTTIQNRSFGNPTLWTTPSHGAYSGNSAIGRSAYMPYGSHGVYVDYQGYVWTGGNGDGIVQKYNPATAGPAGAAATYILQIGTKDVCDTTTGVCTAAVSGANVALNSSTTLLNEPPDIAVDPEVGPVSGTKGDIYIADGYGNARVVVFNYQGQYVGQWGTSCGFDESQSAVVGSTYPFASTHCPFGTFGTGAGHPHCVVLGNDGLVYVCDRPNSRIQVFKKTCAAYGPQPPPAMVINPMNNPQSNQPICPPVRVIYVSNFPGNFPTVTSGTIAAVLNAGTRACDMDFWPNIDYLADQSPKDQKYIVDVDLDGDNTYLIEKPTKGTGDVTSTTPVVSFIGRGSCGFGPCPGHNPGEFAYSHTTNVDSQGNVYVAETITGRRIQRFVPVEEEKH
jgi:NHL repeat